MSVNVYYTNARSTSRNTNSISKVKKLLNRIIAENPKALKPKDLCAIKIHFGELGNDAYISPVLARVAADIAKEACTKPFFTDTNTLYSGSRSNAVDHALTATAHGFVQEVCGAPVIIADGLKSNSWKEVPMPESCTHFKAAKIAQGIIDADSMIVLSHVKGHEMAGFGGAIKNLAMGCAPFIGKRDQHCVKFNVSEDLCIACKQCINICPVQCITLQKNNNRLAAHINHDLCIGCGECLAHCPPQANGKKAIVMDWKVGLDEFTEKMTEYALAAVLGKKENIIYINIVQKVVPLCDCVAWSDIPVVPDIGFLASTDPVAIDQASFDLVKNSAVWPGSMLDGKAKQGDDKFTAMHPNTYPELQLSHGQKIGLGDRSYTLITI